MKNVDIYLKNGQVVTLDHVKDFKVNFNVIGEMVGIQWELAEGWTKHLLYVDASEVAAIVQQGDRP